MTAREHHVASAVPVAFLAVVLGHHPAVAVPLLVGVLLPELDAVRSRTHRSWALHTLLLPAVLYVVFGRLGVFEAAPPLLDALNFVAVGTALHLLADYVYPRTMSHEGAVWPVRPVGFSAPWGLLWLGVSWTIQWFGYIVPELVPWLFGL
ncbi:hypothetical protein ACFO0N_06840 [Halobium salinum]|uniref:LexA-binding, inner membrane-associated hydrolase n=1 Tax=Halobium salinum TaxID=1364940 RepID=A0ABD5PB33_9EURY|nr:hypothetical protein [Halobium salinum]